MDVCCACQHAYIRSNLMKLTMLTGRLLVYKSLLAIPRHPNIIPLYDAFLMPSTRELHFVFECMEGNLYQLTKSRKGRPLATGLIISIFKDIIAGLHHIHAAGYFHRDLKPENLLLSTTGLCEYPNATKGGETERDVLVEVKIADFGLAREISSLPPYTEYVSTRWYRAPEVLLRARDYSAPVDIWAVGTIMAEVINLRPMFPGSSEVTQVISICEVLGTPSDDWGTESTGLPRGGGAWAKGMKMAKAVGFQWPKCPPVKFPELFSPRTPIGLIDVIHATLQYEPKRRLTTAGLIRHPFFNGQTTKMKPLRAKGLIVEETNAAHAADLARQQNEARIAAEEAAAAALRTSMRASEEPPRALPPSHAHSRDSIKPKFGATSPSVHEIPLPLVGGPAAHRTPFYPSTHAGDGETYAHLSLQAAAAAASSSGQRGTVYDVDMSSASHSANAPPLPAADLRDHHAMETDTSKPKKKMGWGSRIFGNQKEANAAAAAAAAASQTNKGQAQSYSHLPLSGAPPYAGPGVGTAMHGVSAVFNPSYASFGSGEVPSSGRDDGFSPYGPYGRGAGDYPAPASQSAVQISDESLYEVLQEGGKPRRRNRDAGPKVQPPPVEDNRSKQLLKKRAMQAGVGKELSAFELGGSFVQSVVGLHTQTNDEIFSVQGGDFDPDIVAAYGGANGQLQEELRPRDQSESGSNGQHDMYEPWEQQLNGAQANRYRQQTGASMQSHRSGESDPGPAYRRSFLPGGRRQGTAASSESVPSVFDRRYRGNSGVPSDMPSVFGNPQSRDGQSIHSVDSELVADMRKMFPRGDQASARGQSRGSANSVREASSPLHQPGINPPAAGRYHPYGAPNRPNSGRPHSGQQAAGLPSPMRHSPGVPRLADLRAAPVDHHRPSIPVRGHTSQDAFAPNGAQQTFEKTDYGYNVANNPQLSLPHPNYLGQAPQPVPWARTMPTRPQQPGTYPSLPSFKDFVADAEMDT